MNPDKIKEVKSDDIVNLKKVVCDAKRLTIENGEVWTPLPNEYGSFLHDINDENLKILRDNFPQKSVSALKDSTLSANVILENSKVNGKMHVSHLEEDITELWHSDDSVKDPNFEVGTEDHEISGSDEENVPNRKRGRKRKACVDELISNRAKILRNSGKEYKFKFTNKMVCARSIKPPCTSCKYNCIVKIDRALRENIFEEYWKIGNLSGQRDFIIRHMGQIKPQYRYPKEGKSRNYNYAFHFKKGGENIRVSKQFFMATLDINRRTIKTTLEKHQDGFMEQDLRGKHGHHKTVDQRIKDDIKDNINSIPRIESHYLRAQITREFQFNDIKVFKVTQDNPTEFFYKTSYLDDFKKVDIYQEKKKNNTAEQKKKRSTRKSTAKNNKEEHTTTEGSTNFNLESWNEPTGISMNKKKDLMTFANGNYIPRVYFDFYNSLKTQSEP